MKKALDKLRNKIRYNKKIMLFLIIIVILGIISGSFLAAILKNEDKLLIKNSIGSFIKIINGNQLNYFDTLKNTFFINLIMILGIWLLGISMIGLFIAIIIVFFKAFIFGFTVASFIVTYNIKGLLLAFIYTFPHLVINLLILMYLGSYAMKFSILIIRCLFSKVNLNLKKLMFIYSKVLFISLITIIITSFFETYITTNILKFVVSLLFK